MGLELFFAAALLGANSFFVAVEFSVTRLRPTQADQYIREHRPEAASAKHAADHIDAYLSAQLGDSNPRSPAPRYTPRKPGSSARPHG